MVFQDDSELLDLNTVVVTALVCHQESLTSEESAGPVIVTCSASPSPALSPASSQKRRRTTSLPDILEEDSIT